MNTGKLNRRITYQINGTYIDDGLGGKTLSVVGATVDTWCSAVQLSMRDLISYGLPVDYKTFEFKFHYDRGANLSKGMNLTYENKTFKIVQVTEKDEAKQEIVIIAVNQG